MMVAIAISSNKKFYSMSPLCQQPQEGRVRTAAGKQAITVGAHGSCIPHWFSPSLHYWNAQTWHSQQHKNGAVWKADIQCPLVDFFSKTNCMFVVIVFSFVVNNGVFRAA
jgi:hypothetical protein